MNKVKNLGYDRWLICKQPRQESGLCCFSFARYLRKFITQTYRALYRDVLFVWFVSFGGAQIICIDQTNKKHKYRLFQQPEIRLRSQAR